MFLLFTPKWKTLNYYNVVIVKTDLLSWINSNVHKKDLTHTLGKRIMSDPEVLKLTLTHIEWHSNYMLIY